MKKFSTGTKGRKLEHSDGCKTAIVEFAIAKLGGDTLAREYIVEVDPANDAEVWTKWQDPALAAVDFQKWLGEDIKTPTVKPAIAVASGMLESQNLKKELEQARKMLNWSGLIIASLLRGEELSPELRDKLTLLKGLIQSLKDEA